MPASTRNTGTLIVAFLTISLLLILQLAPWILNTLMRYSCPSEQFIKPVLQFFPLITCSDTLQLHRRSSQRPWYSYASFITPLGFLPSHKTVNFLYSFGWVDFQNWLSYFSSDQFCVRFIKASWELPSTNSSPVTWMFWGSFLSCLVIRSFSRVVCWLVWTGPTWFPCTEWNLYTWVVMRWFLWSLLI